MSEQDGEPSGASAHPTRADDRSPRGGRLGHTVSALVAVPPGTPWHRHPRVGLGLVVASTVVTLLLGSLGPSVVTLDLGPRGSWLPPWAPLRTGKGPNPWLAAFAGYVAVLVGAAGLWVCLRALAAHWRPRVRHLWGLGVLLNLVTITVAPMTSADVLMYSAYGRLARLGYNPYVDTPAQVFRVSFDPVLRWTERPWQDVVNVYGPLLYWMQYLASVLGGDNMHDTVFWLQLMCCLAFIGASSGVLWIARGDLALQRRVIVWTLVNPMLIWAVVTAAHNEAVSLVLAVGGLLMVRRHPFWAGLLVGSACTGKVTVAMYGIGIAWAYRREIKKLLVFLVGAAIPNVAAYIVFYPEALKVATQNASYVHSSSWLFPIRSFIRPFLVDSATETVISCLAWGTAIVLGWMLSRVLPWRPLPGAPAGVGAERDPLVIAVRTTTLVAAAWVITGASSLAWYDLLYILPMALLGATKLDWVAVVHLTMLNVGYVVGRVIAFSPTMTTLSTRSKETVSATLGVGVIVAVILWWYEHGLRVGSHTRGPHEGDELERTRTGQPPRSQDENPTPETGRPLA